MKYVIVLLLFLLLGFSTPFALRYFKLLQVRHSFISQPALMQTSPPSSAQVGQVNFTGVVSKLSRNTSDFAPLTQSDTFVQGETLKTDAGATAQVSFDNIADLTLQNNTQIAAVNTNPTGFLLTQAGGTVDYLTADPDKPLSVKILHLLVNFAAADASIAIDAQDIIITVREGTLKLAYEDKNNVTHLIDVTSRHKLVFDDTNRTFRTLRYR